MTTFKVSMDVIQGERYTSPTVHDFGRDDETDGDTPLASSEWATFRYPCWLTPVVREDDDQ